MPALPDYLLFTEALRHASGRYLWRFMLLASEGDQTVTASDLVDETSSNRTELLALVRGLEAADAPSNVRLFTSSSYISRGLTRGLAQWRSQKWHWERFGRRVPIRDCDLWQRVDHALRFHTIDCRVWGEATPAADELAYEPFIEVQTSVTSDMADEPAVMVLKRPKHRRQRDRGHSLGQRTLGQLRDQVGSLLEPRWLPAG
jgi:ribonuclease HI